MSLSNTFSIISKYKSELMGFAALWIVLFHSGLETYMPNTALYFFFGIGYSGVDIFFLVSGFGLYYSSLKPQSRLDFYKKRFLRIYPTYAILLVSIFIFMNYIVGKNYQSLSGLLWQLSTLDLWLRNGAVFWYIPAIFAMYLFFPFYIRIYNKQPLVTLLITFVFSILLTATITYFTPLFLDFRLFFTTRIPMFCLGILLGQLSLSKQEKPKYLNALLLGGFIVGLTILFIYKTYYLFEYYSLLSLLWMCAWLFIPALTMMLCHLFKLLDSKLKVVNSIFRFFGSISLELYLIHFYVFQYIDNVTSYFQINVYIAVFFLFVISVIASVILLKISQVISKKLLA